jgi:sugar (pentulose or hexulose) kinase
MTIHAGQTNEVFIGVDVGTQGVRAVALDEFGQIVASARHMFPSVSFEEQSTDQWWAAVVGALRSLGATLAASPSSIPVALAVTGTSGTIIPLNAAHRPLHAALMYGDRRSSAQVQRVAEVAPALGANTSWGLPKMLWYRDEYPEEIAQLALWAHPCDYILGRLTGRWRITDVTNALKSGYDVVAQQWPDSLSTRLNVDPETLPVVVPSGTPLGPLLPEISAEIGLPAAIQVTTGMTDGCASQVATGAVRPGEWNATIGTTLVIKGVTERRIADPATGVYSHRHPDGGWMPGGASNTGAEWVGRDFAGANLDELERAAERTIPTGGIAYPLGTQGERFPFLCPAATGFDPIGFEGARLFAARMEGTAYVERMAFELMETLAGEPVKTVLAAGGGSRNELWLRIRASVLGRPVAKARNGEAAAGAAVIAAAGTRFGTLKDAVAAMTGIETTIEPGPLTRAYDDSYRRFVEELTHRGYLGPSGAQ